MTFPPYNLNFSSFKMQLHYRSANINKSTHTTNFQILSIASLQSGSFPKLRLRDRSLRKRRTSPAGLSHGYKPKAYTTR